MEVGAVWNGTGSGDNFMSHCRESVFAAKSQVLGDECFRATAKEGFVAVTPLA